MDNKLITLSQEKANDVVASLKARSQFIWVRTGEEVRVEGYLFKAALAAKYVPHTWDIAQGACQMNGKPEMFGSPPRQFGGEVPDPVSMIQAVIQRSQTKLPEGATPIRDVWIMRDLPVWLEGIGGAAATRSLRNFARSVILPATAQVIIVLSPSSNVPPELAGHATVIDWPLPDRNEIATILDGLIKEYDLKDLLKNGKRDAAIDAAIGLSGEEATACYSKSLVQTKTVDPVMVSKEKKRVIAATKLLEWYDPLPDGLDSVGGLENLKSWFLSRVCAYSPEARAYGLPLPKGMFLFGVSGCGKSLTCKAVGTVLQCPLLRVDLGALKNELVGRSEANLRRVFEIIKTVGKCVVWFDEIEKALQGATSGSADGGVSSDALGAILTWMQERQGEAFVVMTANDVSQLPPEFLRKGRFDEVWWIDLPTETERVAVLKAALRANKRTKAKIDFAAVAGKPTKGFTGSEIAELIPDALYRAYADGPREITTEDLIKAADNVVPLSVTMDKKIKDMRNWAKGRARPATKPETEAAIADEEKPRVRMLDLEMENGR